jgi:hypothetical protein
LTARRVAASDKAVTDGVGGSSAVAPGVDYGAPMMRLRAARGVLVLVGLASAAAGADALAASGAAPHAGGAKATTVVKVRPVDSKGKLRANYTVTQHFKHAQCNAGSEAIGSAYRCFAGNFVLDPCWATASDNVVCLSAPWSHDVVRADVTKGFDNTGFSDKPDNRAWGMKIAHGPRCGYLEGATGAVDNRRINYGCSHKKYVLIGNVDKHHTPWRIRKAKPKKNGNGYTYVGWVNLEGVVRKALAQGLSTAARPVEFASGCRCR